MPGLLPLLLSACAGVSVPNVPAALQPDGGERLLPTVAARGVQVYECRSTPGAAPAWTLLAPGPVGGLVNVRNIVIDVVRVQVWQGAAPLRWRGLALSTLGWGVGLVRLAALKHPFPGSRRP